MKLTLLSSIALSIFLAHHSANAQGYLPKSDCIQLCYDYRKNQLSKQVCNPTMNMTPKPAMYKSCTHGLFMGFEHACIISCSGEAYKEESGVQPGNSFEACKSEGRNSKAMDWCRHAYDVTFKITPAAIQAQVEKQLQNVTNINHRIMLAQDDDEVEEEAAGPILSIVKDDDVLVQETDVVILDDDDDNDDKQEPSTRMETFMPSTNVNDAVIESKSESEEMNNSMMQRSDLDVVDDVVQPESTAQVQTNQPDEVYHPVDEIPYALISTQDEPLEGKFEIVESADDDDDAIDYNDEDETLGSIVDYSMAEEVEIISNEDDLSF